MRFYPRIELRDGKVISVPGGLAAAPGGITWDFETGDLRGWSKTGDAFNFQPTYGDNPTARHRGQPS